MNGTTSGRSIPMVVWQVALGVAFLLAWEWGADSKLLDKFFFSRPSDVLARMWQWISSGSIWGHLAVTFTEALLSFAIGVLFGVVFGFLFARVPLLAALLDPYIQIANSLPRVVLAPIFLLWFGLGIWSKVALGVTVVFFIVFFNTYQGVREVDPFIINNARMLGASERQLIRHVLVPSALTWIFSSLHVSIGFAIIAVVVGEYLGASKGIGYTIAQAEGVFDIDTVFAGILVLTIFALILDFIVTKVESKLLVWRPGTAETEAL